MSSGRALIWGVGVVLVGALLAGGAIRPPVTLLVASASALLVLLAAHAAAEKQRPLRLPPLALPPLVLAVLCLAQLLPLPSGLRAFLTPEAERVARLVLSGLAPTDGWRPITVDVAATLHDALRLFGLVALAVAIDAFDRRDRRRLRTALAVALAALIAVPAMHSLGFPLPRWIFAPPTTDRRHMFSLVNPNHAAAAIAMLLPTVLVLAARETGGRRLALIMLAVGANFALVASASRAGVVLGVVAQIAALWTLTRRRDIWGRRRLVAVGAAGLVLAFAVVGARFAERVRPEQLSYRLAIWRPAVDLVRDHLWTGVGHGGFSLVIPRYAESGGYWRYGFVENEYLQLFVDVGVIGALLTAVAVVVAARRAWAGVAADSLGAKAAIIGLGVLALHNAVDFSWAGAGVAGAAMALGALAFPSSGSRLTRPAVAAIVALPLALGALAVTPLGRTFEKEAERLIADAPRDEATFAAAFRRHPSDGYLADLAASALFRVGNPSAWLWLDRALLLGPRDSFAHSLAARALAAAGYPDQAAVEMEAALAHANHRDHKALFEQAFSLFPGDENVGRLVTAFCGNLERQHDGLGLLAARGQWRAVQRLATAVLDERPNDVTALRRLLEAKRHLGDRASIAELARRLMALDDSHATISIVTPVLIEEKDFAAAERVLENALARDSKTMDPVTSHARLLIDNGETQRARTLLESWLARAVGAHAKATLHNELARLWERDGNPHRAAIERAAAKRLQP